MKQNSGTIREYRSGDEVSILKLRNKVLSSGRAINHWTWQFKDNVQGQGLITLAEVECQIVGHYAMMRNNLNFAGLKINAGQSCDTMVRADQRGQKWFTKLAAANYKMAKHKGITAVAGFPNNKSYPGFIRNLEWHRIANLKFFYYRIGLRKIWRKIIDFIFKFFMSFLYKSKHRISLFFQKDIEITTSQCLPENIEHLLKEIRDGEVLSVWKDESYLKWRYENHPDYCYKFHILYKEKKIENLIITRDCGETVAICDLFSRTKNIKQTVLLLSYVISYYYTSKAQKIEFYGYDNGFFDAVLNRAHFKRIGYSNFIFGGRVFENNKFEKFFIEPQNWTIAYGDTDVI